MIIQGGSKVNKQNSVLAYIDPKSSSAKLRSSERSIGDKPILVHSVENRVDSRKISCKYLNLLVACRQDRYTTILENYV